MAKKDHRCHKFATEESFNNLHDGSQDFSNAMIRSPRIATSFINSGSGFQDFKDSKIYCHHKSISNRFQDVAGSHTFPGFTVLNYLQTLLTGCAVFSFRDRNPETKIKKSKT
ncbi:hypothetical protein VNO80_10683 [Phaseolus coccineus]|uniref:Uncharacterized protein n=1 Tax=Phaseolus coccineus TaxID=3886 RepID=A0AAN9N8M3_PHACN